MAFALKDYSALKEVGRGGMGTVYSATQTSLNRKVAIKKMSVDLLADTKLVKRFETEAKSAASLDHDNVIRIYDFGEENGAFYMAMEFVDGVDLGSLMDDKGTPTEINLMVMLQAIKGLHYAHQKGIIHRDIKPGNIIISKNGRVKVLDFGLAYVSEQSVQLTAADGIVGTPLYMSPEQATGETIRDTRSDIFSIGVMLYRILTGKAPFGGSNVPSILYNIIHTKEEPVEEAVPTLPSDLADNINRCLEKELAQRLPSLPSLIESLQNYFFDLGVRDTTEELAKQLSRHSTGVRGFISKIVGYHLRKGKEFASSGEYKKSNAHLKQVLRYDPKNDEVTKIINELGDIETTLPQGQSAAKQGISRVSRPISAVTKYREKVERQTRKWIWGGAALGVIVLALTLFIIFKPQEEKPGPAAAKTTKVALPSSPAKATTPPVQEPPKEVPQKVKKIDASVKKKTPIKKRPVRRRSTASKPKRIAPKPKAVRFARVRVSVDPPGANVYWNGRRLSTREMRNGVKAKAGRYTLSASMSGYETKEMTRTIKAGANRTFSILLKKRALGTGALFVFSKPWANLYIDGQRMGITPTRTDLILQEGTHSLVLKRDGFEEYKTAVTIEKNGRTPIRIVLKKLGQ